MAYRREVIALDNVQSEPVELESRHSVITEVVVTRVPDGATFALHFGRDADRVDIDDKCSFKPTGVEAENGLYWSNDTAQAGVEVVLAIVTGARAGLDTELAR
jgi:hypothetical protein